MRLLIGMPHKESYGGPPACEPPFVEELKKINVEVTEFVYTHEEKQKRKPTISERVVRVIRTALSLRRTLRAHNFDLVHLNTSFDFKALLRDFATVILIWPFKGRLFLKMHGSDADLLRTRNPILRLMIRTLFSRVHGIGVLSSEERDNFIRSGLCKFEVFKVRSALKAGLYIHDPQFAETHGLPEGTPVLLYISRFIHSKGLIDTIRASKIVLDQGLAFALFCVGDGPARQEAEQEVERLGMQACVKFFGYVPEHATDTFYANSSILLLPTAHFEGLPLVILHSLAAGIPIITTRIRGAADYLLEPRNCLWTEARKPEMLAAKIVELLNSSETRAQMSRNNRDLAQQFSASVTVQEYVCIFEELITRGAVQPRRQAQTSIAATFR